jgi:hypothetical protein
MRIAFCILMNLLAFVICLGYPFQAVLRARGFARPILVAWGGMVLWTIGFSLGVPAVTYFFSHELAREMQLSWVPEPTGIFPVAVIGWWPPLVAAVVALGTRRVLRRMCPGALTCLESESRA